jgi:ribosomal protein L11 methyltransferase
MKHYKKFIITSEPFLPEVLGGILWELKINGISEENDNLFVFADEDSEVKKDTVAKLLTKLVNENLINNFDIREVQLEEENWNEEWEKTVNVVEVTDRIVIKPTFKKYEPKPDQLIITIDPKMSFGTGQHATTKLMIKFLQKYIKPDMKVLDIGTGTGVLAIAAAKLGASSVYAIDNDDGAIQNCKENVELNSAGNKINISLGEIKNIPDTNFDIILANIQHNILMLMADEIKNKMKKRGIVILAGLFEGDEDSILNTYRQFGFELLETGSMDEWISLIFKLT